MARIISGVKPSGDMTIGNYLGAMKRWVEPDQNTNECLYFIANLHAITVRQDPVALRKRSLDVAAWLLTVGVDPKKSAIFMQSMVPAHSEICWILTNFVTVGELNKMTQFKDKSQKLGKDGQLAGLLEYPVLMAGDVLLYDADEVPVGDDQTQHVELTRNIATRFNNIYGDTFKIPKATVSKVTGRIKSLKDPNVKMSKSEDADDSYILLQDDPETVIKKFKRAVTDSDNQVRFDLENKPAISNLLVIYSGFTERPIEEIETEYKDAGYGKFKNDVGESVAQRLNTYQNDFKRYRDDESYLMEVIKNGNDKANELADKKVKEVYDKLGLIYK